MTNLEIYQALSLKGRRGAKKQVLEITGLSINMVTRILKHGLPSQYEAQVVEAALKVIENYSSREREVAQMRLEAAKKQYAAVRESVESLIAA